MGSRLLPLQPNLSRQSTFTPQQTPFLSLSIPVGNMRQLAASILLLAAISSIVLSYSPSGFRPTPWLRREPRLFRGGPGVWSAGRGLAQSSDLAGSESRVYDTLGQVILPPPGGRFSRGSPRLHKFKVQDVRGKDEDLMETAADSPYHVAVEYPGKSYGPPHDSGWSHGPSGHSGWSEGPSGPPHGHHSHSGWSHDPPKVKIVHHYPPYDPEPPLSKGKTPPKGSTTPSRTNTPSGVPGRPGTFPDPTDPSPGPRDDPQCAQELNDRNISRPSDVDPSWRLIDGETRLPIDPTILLNPPLLPLPPSPQQLSADVLDDHPTAYVERLSLDFEETARNAGYSVVRDRVTSLNTSSAVSSNNAPQPSSNSVTSVVTIRTPPRLSAPLQGFANSQNFFTAALEASRTRRGRRQTRSPVENFILTDLQTMGDLFQDLQDHETRTEDVEVTFPVRTDEHPELLQMPMIISRTERFGIPEPNHSERSILDAEFNFGLPASHHQFESVSRLVDDWKEMTTTAGSVDKFLTTAQDIGRVYTGMAQFYASLEEFARARAVFARGFGAESFIKAEDIAQSSYKAHQFLVCLDRDDPNCESSCAIDPLTASSMFTDGRSGGRSVMTNPRDPRQRLRARRRAKPASS